MSNRAIRPPLRSISVAAFIAIMSAAALLCLRASSPLGVSSTETRDPQLMVLSDVPGTIVDYQLDYVTFSDANAAGVRFGGPAGSLPTDTRILRLQFKAPRPGVLRYAVMMNRDAVLTDPQASPRNSSLDVASPGTVIGSDCVGLSRLGPSQVLHGTLPTDRRGYAAVDLFGGVATPPHFDSNAIRQAVSVMAVLPNLPRPAAESCAVNLPDWPYLSDRTWSPVTYQEGTVLVGAPSHGVRIEAAVPTLDRTDRLEWHTNGGATFSYDLVDDNRERAKAIYLFLAGVFASLAGSAFVTAVVPGRRRQPPGPPLVNDQSTTGDLRSVVALAAIALGTHWLRRARPRTHRPRAGKGRHSV